MLAKCQLFPPVHISTRNMTWLFSTLSKSFTKKEYGRNSQICSLQELRTAKSTIVSAIQKTRRQAADNLASFGTLVTKAEDQCSPVPVLEGCMSHMFCCSSTPDSNEEISISLMSKPVWRTHAGQRPWRTRDGGQCSRLFRWLSVLAC